MTVEDSNNKHYFLGDRIDKEIFKINFNSGYFLSKQQGCLKNASCTSFCGLRQWRNSRNGASDSISIAHHQTKLSRRIKIIFCYSRIISPKCRHSTTDGEFRIVPYRWLYKLAERSVFPGRCWSRIGVGLLFYWIFHQFVEGVKR